jgi:amidohydrolase
MEETYSIQEDIIKWRRELHKIPELDLYLPKTSKYVMEELNKINIKTKLLKSCSGIIGLIEGKLPGKNIAIRADMDGLPIKEETGLPFSSINNNMHACGHDAHTAMLLGAAKILVKNVDKIYGNVKLIFQPGEERTGGARLMIEEGVLENPHIDTIIGQHIGNIFPHLKNGQIGVCSGTMMASQDHFTVKIKGKGTHGAFPANGIDPIVITSYVITALQTLVSRELNGTDSAVITIGRINGGKVYNIIPDKVEFEGSLRCLDKNIRKNFEKRIKYIISNTARAMRGESEIEYIHGIPLLSNNKKITKSLIKSAEKIIGTENIIELKEPTMGSEDMSYFLEKVPGSFYFLSSAPLGRVYPHHNPKFDIDENVLWKGVAILVQTVIDWLGDNH